MEKYINRKQAGSFLASLMLEYDHHPHSIALALPRGGVPVAYEIAQHLSIPLDVFIVRKLGVPWHKELAFGAISSGEKVILNQDIVTEMNLSKEAIADVIQEETKELHRRELLYRGTESPPDVKDKVVFLIDDGVATGASMKAAVLALKQYHPSQIIVGVPVVALSTYFELSKLVDKVICPLKPKHLIAVGVWYNDFSQTSDEEVCELLKKNIPNA